MSNETARLEARITDVILYEDRCEVTRKGRGTLSGGSTSLRLVAISPLVHPDRTVVRAHTPDGEPRFVDEVRVRHRWIADASGAEKRLEELRAARQDAEHRVEACRKRVQGAEVAAQRVQELVSRYFTRAGLAQWESCEGDAATYRRDFGAFAADLERLNQALRGHRTELQAAIRDAASLAEMIDRARDRRERLVADVDVLVSGGEGAVELVVTTQMPCGVWRPAHEATLEPVAEGSARKLTWTTLGTVWQHTGEDWDDVTLTFSTDRPSLGAELPALEEDELSLRLKTAEERRTVFVEHRLEKGRSDDLGRGAPGVYDGGEARELRAAHRASVKSDGKPVRVRIESFSSEGTFDRVAFPDEAALVFRRVQLTNPTERPLLAGPVTLLEGGAYVGVAELNYVGPRERFALGFGSDDALRVKCERSREIEERRLAKDRVHFVTTLEVENTSTERERFDIYLRYPISEVAQLKVIPSMTWCTGGEPKPDDNGLLKLPVVLEPGARQQMKVGFHFETSGDVNVPDPW